MDTYSRANLENWNERATVHAASKFYDIAGFKLGNCTLKEIEQAELERVEGKSLLHLQCHIGLDSLSWARLGAKVTGVDFSDKAIDLATSLSLETKIEARFIRSEIYALPAILTDRFDIVFASYGVLCWVSDVSRWMKIAADYVMPGGVFYLVDDHPFADMFDSDLLFESSYFHSVDPIQCGPEVDYADREALLLTPNYQWKHSLSDVVNAAVQAGLQIEFVHEFPFSAWERFPGMMKEENGRYVMANPKMQIPLLFSIKAGMGSS